MESILQPAQPIPVGAPKDAMQGATSVAAARTAGSMGKEIAEALANIATIMATALIVATVVLLVLMVQALQLVGDAVARRLDHR